MTETNVFRWSWLEGVSLHLRRPSMLTSCYLSCCFRILRNSSKLLKIPRFWQWRRASGCTHLVDVEFVGVGGEAAGDILEELRREGGPAADHHRFRDPIPFFLRCGFFWGTRGGISLLFNGHGNRYGLGLQLFWGRWLWPSSRAWHMIMAWASPLTPCVLCIV